MTKQENKNPTYDIKLNNAHAVAIGDSARVEQHLHLETPTQPSISRVELLKTVRQCGAELRNYHNVIAGIHIERAEVNQIADWVLSASSREKLAVVLDQPGTGKTVVMRDLLERLESADVPVLAIKADALSGVNSRDDLADRLGLPLTVEQCVENLVNDALVVALIDQLDALSLALSRDQVALDIILGTLARLRDMDGVRVVASCRIFDLNNDPRLSQIHVDRTFNLQPLQDEQIDQVLRAIHDFVPPLLPVHRSLFAVPLHLDVYARIAPRESKKQPIEGFCSLQELYAALWRKWIETVPPESPGPSERISAIYHLVEAMQGKRQLTVPFAVLDKYPRATSYLERNRIIKRARGGWLFFHQTWFDYCYARRFVAEDRSICSEVLSGSQGLFERSQLIQVLAYLRGSDERAYLRELKEILFAEGLRVHLRLLLIGWIGALPDPSANELLVARQLVEDKVEHARFLRAVGGNEAWFDLLNENLLPSLIRSDDDDTIDATITHLGAVIEKRTSEVLARLRPFLGTSDTWDSRIAYCLSHMDSWHSKEALDILCDLLRRGRAFGRESSYFHSLAQANPKAGCKALRAHLDRRLHELLEEAQPEGYSRFRWDQKLLGEYSLGMLIERAVEVCPEEFLKHLLPWFEEAALILSVPDGRGLAYLSDTLFSRGWHGEHISEGASFARRVSEALAKLAQTRPDEFRAFAAKLSSQETMATHRVLVRAYLANAEAFIGEMHEYIVGDIRRLKIGESLESPHYDSCLLYGTIYRHSDTERRRTLEQLILDHEPQWEKHSLRHRGITQLRFLKSVPLDLLSQTSRLRRLELERKFPNFELHSPKGIVWSTTGPPIDKEAQDKMSDENWLRAMRKYGDTTGWGAPREEFLKGGVVELSRALVEHVKTEPERFYRLALRFDENISLQYLVAIISGLAESDAPVEWLFDLARKYSRRFKSESRIGVCRALNKRAEEEVPDDLIEMMAEWTLNDPDPEKELWRVIPEGSEHPYHGGDPYSQGINSTRGVALETVCRCAMLRNPPKVERAFKLLEQSCDDPSTAVRSCVIQSLGPLLKEDDRRTLSIFLQALERHEGLLKSQLVHRFLYWTYYQHFSKIRPVVEALLASPEEVSRQAGARVACMAAFRHPEATDLAQKALQGDDVTRRGAAQVYARNLEHRDLEDECRENLIQLMYDPDEQVRTHVGECFSYLRPEHLVHNQPMIEDFLVSPSLLSGADHLIKYLKPLAGEEHELSLNATERILDLAGEEVVDFRTSRSVLEPGLVSLPLSVYTHSNEPAIKGRAMDLFENLLLLGSRAAYKALADWDRR